MFGRILLIGTVIAAIAAGVVWGPKYLANDATTSDAQPAGEVKAPDEAQQAINIGADLYASPVPQLPVSPKSQGLVLNPVVIGDCQISPLRKEEVPATRDGFIRFIGTEFKPGEENTLPPGEIITGLIGGQTRKFRKLHEDERVEEGQLLAVIDDRVAVDEYEIKKTNVTVTIADRDAAEATYKEAQAQYVIAQQLHNRDIKAMSAEQLRTAAMAATKYLSEYKSKIKLIEKAEKEENQAKTMLGLHEIRAAIPGVIKTIYKQPGEGVKTSPSPEPLFQIVNLDKLKVEGLVDEQHYQRLKPRMQVVIERSLPQTPVKTCFGHLQEVTGVAIAANGPKLRVVSGSADGTVRVWEGDSQGEVARLDHPRGVAIRAVACSPKGAKENLCLSGGSDGTGRLWTLNDTAAKPIRVLETKHRNAIQCVAFSPDGTFCATGGEDRDILIHETATGALKYRLPGHRGAVTSLQFLPQAELLSAGRDNALGLWKLGTDAGKLVEYIEGRSGDVTQIAASADGKHVLFDFKQSKSLRILSLPKHLTEGRIEPATGATQFSVLALFSPDAQLVLTASGADGRLQLWRSPLQNGRASIVRQFTAEDRAQPTCGVFSPDGQFIVTGARDKNVYFWEVPNKQEIDTQITAVISRVEPTLDPSSHQVRVWAEIVNAPKDLIPGASVTMVHFPKK